MNRRGFLTAMLAACAAPAVVRASSLMRVRPIVLPGDVEFAAIMNGEIGRYENVTLFDGLQLTYRPAAAGDRIFLRRQWVPLSDYELERATAGGVLLKTGSE